MLETGTKNSQSSESRFINHTEKLEINMLLMEAGRKDHKWSSGQDQRNSGLWHNQYSSHQGVLLTCAGLQNESFNCSSGSLRCPYTCKCKTQAWKYICVHVFPSSARSHPTDLPKPLKDVGGWIFQGWVWTAAVKSNPAGCSQSMQLSKAMNGRGCQQHYFLQAETDWQMKGNTWINWRFQAQPLEAAWY